MLVVDFERIWPRASGEVFRGRYAITAEESMGDRGDWGFGSVDLRIVRGFVLSLFFLKDS